MTTILSVSTHVKLTSTIATTDCELLLRRACEARVVFRFRSRTIELAVLFLLTGASWIVLDT